MHFLTFLYRKSGGNNFMDQNFSFNIPQQSFPLQIPDNPNSFMPQMPGTQNPFIPQTPDTEIAPNYEESPDIYY